VSLLRWPRRCPHSLPTELDAQVRADGTNNRGLLHERHRRGRKVVQARATGLGCHGAVPVVCQKKNRLSPCPLAVITVDFPVWATDGVEKVVPVGHLFRVPGGGSDGLPEKRQASIRAVAGDTAGVPAWATEGADATLLARATYSGCRACGPDGLPVQIEAMARASGDNHGRERMLPLVTGPGNDGGVNRLAKMYGLRQRY
jgi:hypothetical protein